MLGDVNKLIAFKSLLTMPSNVLSLDHKKIFPPIIRIFTEGDGIKSSLPSKTFSTLNKKAFGPLPREYLKRQTIWLTNWEKMHLKIGSSFAWTRLKSLSVPLGWLRNTVCHKQKSRPMETLKRQTYWKMDYFLKEEGMKNNLIYFFSQKKTRTKVDS